MGRVKTIVAVVFSVLILTILVIMICKKEGIAQSASQGEGDTVATSEFVFTAPYIPNEIEFAGEKVPLNNYWVREGVDRELITASNQHTLTMLSMKRSGRWFPIIEQIMKEEGLPDDFKYLCVAESNLQNVISPAKATGFWQFMEKTAKLYDLEVREDVDERYDVEKSTHAACKYLIGSKKRLGTWSLAAAAYNMGEAGVKKQMTEQSCNSYWNLYLNQETARYMYRIIAYKLIFENPERYHYKLLPEDLYSPIACDTLRIDTTITSLHSFALSQNITYKELKDLNPWLRGKKLTVTTKPYTIKVPKK